MNKILLLLWCCTMLGGCVSDLQQVDLQTYQKKSSPNNYLVCPKDYCKSMANETSPLYPVNAAQLKSAFMKMAQMQPRTKLLYHNGNSLTYVQRTAILRFPDMIYINIIPKGDKQATLAILSQSVYGHYDFGKNKQRITNWLKTLQHHIKNHL